MSEKDQLLEEWEHEEDELEDGFEHYESDETNPEGQIQEVDDK